MSERKYRAFAFTIRPKNGLTEALRDEFIKWVESKNGGFCVLEGEGTSLHMHGGMFLETETTKSNFNFQLQRHFEKHRSDEDSTRVQRGGTRIMYNMDFLDKYLDKDDSRLVYEKIPDDVEEYFPTQEEQAAAGTKSVDSVMSEYELLMREHFKWERVGDVMELFDKRLYELWFVKKVIRAPRENKRKRELSENLKRWMFPSYFDVNW